MLLIDTVTHKTFILLITFLNEYKSDGQTGSIATDSSVYRAYD